MKKVGTITIGAQVRDLHEGYYDNGRVAIVIDGGRFAKLTINVHDQPLAPGHVHVKMWEENEVLREPALATGLFEDTGERVPCGFARAEVWRYKGA